VIAPATAIVTVLFLHVNSVSVESSLPLLAARAVWERGGRREAGGKWCDAQKAGPASPMKDWQLCVEGRMGN
jgi:hypothetical protein